jgi:hypothetical protein
MRNAEIIRRIMVKAGAGTVTVPAPSLNEESGWLGYPG